MRYILRLLSDKRFCRYEKDIHVRNYRGMRTFLTIGLLLSAIDAAGQLLLNPGARFIYVHFILLGYFMLLFLIYHRLLKETTRGITVLFYLLEAPFFALAIAMGTFLDPGRTSLTFMVLMCALPLLILDRPWRLVTYLTGMAAVYAVCCRVAKPADVFRIDMVNLLSFWLLAVGILVFVLAERIESVEAVVRYREQAERDALTGIYNRGADERVKALLRDRAGGAFIILDIDNFKKINDTYGHEAGDQALVELTEVIARNFRSSDVVMRLGGDEIAIYAVGLMDLARCRRKLEEVRRSAEQIALAGLGPGCVTVSMGCVINTGTEVDYQTLYQQADACMYRAKNAGKNQFEIA